MIRLHRVCKVFEGGPMKLPALNDISFEVDKGDCFVLRVLGAPRRDITPKAFQALKAVGLSSRAQAYPAQLSQGEAQRAALARAIVKSPALLLADEPTGNLDEEMAGEILDLIKDIWSRGTTVLLATHQARLAAQLRRRTVRLEGGVLTKDEG